MTSNDELAAIILPWAKEYELEKYNATLCVAQNARTFRRYLVRLVEIRWARENRTWRGGLPLDVLEESSITLHLRHRPTQQVLAVKGRLAEGTRTWTFAELALAVEEPPMLDLMMRAKATLDLEHVPGTPNVIVPYRALGPSRSP